MLADESQLGVDLRLVPGVDDLAGNFWADAVDFLQRGFGGREDGGGVAKAFDQPAAENGADVAGEGQQDFGAGGVVQ